MREITLYRKPGWYGRIRKLAIFVDGEKAATIKTGETITISVPNDAREIYGKMDWGKTAPFSIGATKGAASLVIISWFSLNPLKIFGIPRIPIRFESSE